MNYNTKRKHKLRQATAKKKVAKKPATKKKKPKMVVYTIYVRKDRSKKRVQAEDTVIHYSPDLARQLAAAKYPGNWVSVSPS